VQQPKTKPFAVLIDLESTGTNTQVDALLELAAIAVDESLEEIASISYTIATTKEALAKGTWSGFWQMHGINGLINDALHDNDRVPLDAVDASFARWLKVLGYDGKDVVLAGNSIGQFDIPMIHAQMPVTAGMLHYRAVDISAQARELKRIVGFERKDREMPHRAYGDCVIELEEWRGMDLFLRNLQEDAARARNHWGHALQSY
jgi:oligoribonuclease (3'-5' exoribonuclease)